MLCCASVVGLIIHSNNKVFAQPQDTATTETTTAESDDSQDKTPPVNEESSPDTQSDDAKETNVDDNMKPFFSPRNKDGKDNNDSQGNNDQKDSDENQEEKQEDDGLESLNLQNVEMKTLLSKLSDWTGKVIIPHEEIMGQRLTIISHKRLPREKVLSHIFAALQNKGYVAEEENGVIYLIPQKDAKVKFVPTIDADQPLALLEDKSQTVQKIFKIRNFQPSKLQAIMQPLLAEGGHIVSDDNSNHIVIVDTVGNLMRFETIIDELDVPEKNQTITETIPIKQGNPVEISQMLGVLLGSDQQASSSRRGGNSREDRRFRRQQDRRRQQMQQQNANSISTIIEGPTGGPIVLIPEPRQNWIIVRCSSEDMDIVKQWIQKLDIKQPIESDYETVSVSFIDPTELALMLNRALQQMPGAELKESVLVEPLPKANQVMIFGSEQNREMVKKLIQESDIPADLFVTKQFKLVHADPQEIKTNLEALYEDINANLPYWRRQHQTQRSPDSVRVIAFTTAKQVTVIASQENMNKIEDQIKEWDQPVDVNEARPRIVLLRNSDPVKLVNLLTQIFTDTNADSWTRTYFRTVYGSSADRGKIVGPLYGQLTFEAVPDTKKIVVISNIPSAYPVIVKFIQDLDEQDIAEIPMIIPLKFADAEILCDQLNALLNKPGTTATIQRSQRNLSEYTQDNQSSNQSGNNNNNNNNNNNQQSTDIITPWWTMDRPTNTTEMPTSNLIGKIRFIPVARSKSILVLTPPEYKESLRKMINELDQPGKQVMVKAIVLRVNQEKLLQLGAKFSSNPNAFGTVGENAFSSMAGVLFDRTPGNPGESSTSHSVSTLNPTTTLDTTTSAITSSFDSTTFNFNFNLAVLIDLLQKETDAQILIQPTLWTKDNEEAIFFNGNQLPFIVNDTLSNEGTNTRRNFDYRKVGVTLRVRPNITPESAVNMNIHLQISQRNPELVEGAITVSELDTSTHMIINNAQTLMLGGITLENETAIETKVPLLGDLPLVGGAFKHTNNRKTKDELLVFITPYVMNDNAEADSNEQIKEPLEKLQETKTRFEEMEKAQEKQ